MKVPRKWKNSTVLGSRVTGFNLKFTIISTVLTALSSRLLSLHPITRLSVSLL